MKAKEQKTHGDVLIESFEYAVLHAGAVGGGAKMRRARKRLSDYIASLRESLSNLAGAANAVYIQDDVFTARREGDGREKRDDDLGTAIHDAVQALK